MRNALLIGSLLLLLTFAGCAEPPQAPPPPQRPAAQQPKSAPTGTVAAPQVAEKPAEDVYAYKPAGRRDPFAPIIVKAGTGRDDKSKPPLERYPVSEFKLAAIVWGGFGYNAMVEGPDGKGYFLKVGTVMGPNRGVVKRITQSSVIVEETYKSYTGETMRKEIIVELRKRQEGMP
jgi:type IV pilus assembly protein PilP